MQSENDDIWVIYFTKNYFSKHTVCINIVYHRIDNNIWANQICTWTVDPGECLLIPCSTYLSRLSPKRREKLLPVAYTLKTEAYFFLPSLIFLDAFKDNATSLAVSWSILSKYCFLLSPGIHWNFAVAVQQ